MNISFYKPSCFILCYILLFSSCNGAGNKVDNKSLKQGDENQDKEVVVVPGLDKVKAKHRDMVTVIRETKNVSGSKLAYLPSSGVTFYIAGVFVEGRNLDIKPYQIGRYEVTYELWCEVLSWALDNNYSIMFQGAGGSKAPDNGNQRFVPPTEENKWHPVTRIPWRSAVVWCNAYSEMLGLKPVYYNDALRKNPIKTTYPCDPKDQKAPAYLNIPNDERGYVDAPYVDWNASGFRLPTEAEWEMAARGGNFQAKEWNYKYAGCDDEAILREYAWGKANSDGITHEVGQKKTNVLGLYDMNGNVGEHCFDWWVGRDPYVGEAALLDVPWYGADKRPDDEKPENSARINKGSSFEEEMDMYNFSLGFRLGWIPTRSGSSIGFRVARSIR